jgi:hypothetical protein
VRKRDSASANCGLFLSPETQTFNFIRIIFPQNLQPPTQNLKLKFQVRNVFSC